MSHYMDNIFSKQSGFRKGYKTQYCLLIMPEKWKSAAEKRKAFGALLTDLFKAFDCLLHDLLLPKLHAYGFSLSALKLIYAQLFEKENTKN